MKNDFIVRQYKRNDTVLQNMCFVILRDILGKYKWNSANYSNAEPVDLWLYYI